VSVLSLARRFEKRRWKVDSEIMAHTGTSESWPEVAKESSPSGKVAVLNDPMTRHRYLSVSGYGMRKIDFDLFMRINSVDPKLRDEGILELIELGVSIVEEENEQPVG
jgi:hypothetical protein